MGTPRRVAIALLSAMAITVVAPSVPASASSGARPRQQRMDLGSRLGLRPATAGVRAADILGLSWPDGSYAEQAIDPSLSSNPAYAITAVGAFHFDHVIGEIVQLQQFIDPTTNEFAALHLNMKVFGGSSPFEMNWVVVNGDVRVDVNGASSPPCSVELGWSQVHRAYYAAVDDFCVGVPKSNGFGVSSAYETLLPGQPVTIILGSPFGPQPFTQGYWLLGQDGGIFSFGSAQFHGSTGGIRLNKPVLGMGATPDGGGYWLVASDGGIFAFGDARFYGSTGAIRLNQPIVGMAATPDGGGYWLVASDGGIFAFGNARFYGSTGAIRLNKPIVGMSATASGHGYRFVASDGGIFSFGDARFYGAVTDFGPVTVTGMSSSSGNGYRVVTSEGWVAAFGPNIFDNTYEGDLYGISLNAPIIGITSIG